MAGTATGNDDEYDAISAARDQAKQSASAAGKRGRVTTSGTQSNFPAVNQVLNPRNTAFARNAPVNTPAMNGLSQIPIGGFGLGALSSVGYSRAPQMNLGNFMNQAPNQTPTLTGYHWTAGTGGVSGGNNANADLTWSNGTRTNMIAPLGGLPALGSTQSVPQSQYPQAPSQYSTTQQGNVNTNVPGGSIQDALQNMAPAGQDYNASTGQWIPASTPGFMSATKGVSQFASAPRTTNQFGQNAINPAGGGQIITDKRFPDKKNQPWLGGQSWGGY